MQVWMILEFAFALASVTGCLALIIGEWHITETAEWQELLTRAREQITNMGSGI